MHGEPARLFELFRQYRDIGPARSTQLLAERDDVDLAERTIYKYARRWSWDARAVAWDDELARIEDEQRLIAIREMHSTHVHAAQTALQMALRGMAHVDPTELTATDIARLLDLGSRLERETLTVSVEELQGRPQHDDAADDPWNAIARELAPPM